MPTQSSGCLRVILRTASGALPIAGGTVRIYSQSTSDVPDVLLSLLTTDRSGRTDLVCLDAPPASLSEVPGGEDVSSLYRVTASFPGFMEAQRTNVAVFDGIVSELFISMIPLSDEERS